MRYIVSLFLCSSLVSCISAHLERDQGDMKTIGYYTGALIEDEGLYRSRFESGAENACAGKKYEVLERTRNPSTLSGMDLPPSKFYWVIRCK
jgi:hypothetical protein